MKQSNNIDGKVDNANDQTTNDSSLLSNLETLKVLLGGKDNPIPDLFDSVEQTQDKIEEHMKNSEPVRKSLQDSYGNALTGVGTDDKIKSFTSYGFENDSMNWTLWMALYNDSWVFRRAIDKPAQDMVRSGIDLQIDSKYISKIMQEVDKHKKSLIELVQWGRLFGGSVAVMMFDNMKDEDYAKPIDISKLRQAKIMTMYVTDRWYGCAVSTRLVDDMVNSDDYGKPYSYDITFANGHTLKVHHDWIIRYEGRTAPRLIKQGSLQGWGYAEGCHIINELARDDQLKASITSLVNKSLIEVIKMPGMRGVFMGADKDNQNQIQKRLEMVNWARNYNSLTFLDKDDEYQEHGFGGLSGLSDLLQQNMWLISSALDMQGVLYGDLKNGFSTDESALERYDETINNLNENYFRTCMHKLLKTIYLWFGIIEEVKFEFGSLVKNKQANDKLDGMKNFQSFASSLLQDGVITLKQYAMAVKNYGEKGVIDFGLTNEYINSLDDKMDEEMENIKLPEKSSYKSSKVKIK